MYTHTKADKLESGSGVGNPSEACFAMVLLSFFGQKICGTLEFCGLSPYWELGYYLASLWGT